MIAVRRMVLLLLLLTVPFQAAWGAGGMLCATMSDHHRVGQVAPHVHDDANVHHEHSTQASDAVQTAAPQASAQAAPDTADKCKVCSECCSAGAPISGAGIAVALPTDTPLRVAILVDPDLISRAGDGLFRPPRTLRV